MTLAPRSWPSRPGLAMTTRILRIRQSALSSSCQLDRRALPRIRPRPRGARRTSRRRWRRRGRSRAAGHRVVAPARGRLQRVERAAHRGRCRASASDLGSRASWVSAGGVVDVEDRDRRLVLLDVVVDADDDLVAPLDRLLEAVGGSRRSPSAGSPARSPRPCRPSGRWSSKYSRAPSLHVERQLLDEIRAAERIDHVGDAALVRDDLLRAQRERRGLGRRQRQRLVERVGVQRVACRRAPPPAPAAPSGRRCCTAAARSATRRRSACGSAASTIARSSRRSGRA